MSVKRDITQLYHRLYGHLDGFQTHFDDLFAIIDAARHQRKPALCEMDLRNRNWYMSQKVVGMTLYTDLFAGSLRKLTDKIDYFKELGINFIHLMPLLKSRPGDNDGGYAVEDYRQIESRLGDMKDFIGLLDHLRHQGIHVCIDYVINHVAKEHEWAKAALKGDPDMQSMFIMFDDDTIPKQYDQTVPEVLPDKYPGNFTYYPEIGKYVFTSFSEFQWDLDFSNPRVFNGMTGHMLYLANLGIDMIRLDAIPFMWKTIGTTCRNLPEVHDLMVLLQHIKQAVCPSVALLGEAIVEPVEIARYFGDDNHPECDVMYNANLMVDIYNAFATRDVRLLATDTRRFKPPRHGTWMNYVRCHDDIGWGFDGDIIASMRFDPEQHKQFLIRFFNNDHPGTFAKGEYYQYHPVTRDARTNGTLASLLGLEKAHDEHAAFKRRAAIDRIRLAHALILTYRGFPLIYAGDEIATLNDQSYCDDPDKTKDGRWVHRPIFDWKRAGRRHVPDTDEFDVYQHLKHMIKLRKQLPYLNGQVPQDALDLGNHHVLCLIRRYQDKDFFALFNFSEHTQWLITEVIHNRTQHTRYLDVSQGRLIDLDESTLELAPYEFLWCKPV